MNSCKWQLKERPKKGEYIIDFDFLLTDIVLERQGIAVSSAGKIMGGEQAFYCPMHILQCAAPPPTAALSKVKFTVISASPFYLVAHIIPHLCGNIHINRQTAIGHAACASSWAIRSLARRAYSSVTSMPVAV